VAAGCPAIPATTSQGR